MIKYMKFGILEFKPVAERLDLVAEPVQRGITSSIEENLYVAEIDPALSDTAAFCERYQIGMDVSANCLIVEAKRADKIWYAACMILATDRADINGTVRKYLDARKISFAPIEKAVIMTQMEFGGITPVGLPEDMPVLVDEAVARADKVVIGSGIRKSKILISGQMLTNLPNATVLNLA